MGLLVGCCGGVTCPALRLTSARVDAQSQSCLGLSFLDGFGAQANREQFWRSRKGRLQQMQLAQRAETFARTFDFGRASGL